MINFLQKMFQDISEGRNLEHYITLIFIIVILALDIFGLTSPDILTEITLAVLALIVFTNLSTRETIEMLSDKFTSSKSADDYFWKEKRSLEHHLSQAKSIGFVGASLSRTLRDYSNILEKRLRLGAEVRIILMDPDSTAPDQAVLRSKGVPNRQFYIDTLRPSLERARMLSETSNKVDLGLLPYKPAFGMVVIDPEEPYGRIIVEMYPHHSDGFAPTFDLQPDRDPQWYPFFQKQFDNLWKACDNRKFSGQEVSNLLENVRNMIS